MIRSRGDAIIFVAGISTRIISSVVVEEYMLEQKQVWIQWDMALEPKWVETVAIKKKVNINRIAVGIRNISSNFWQ